MRVFLILTTCAIASLSARAADRHFDPAEEQLLRAIADGYRANREKFDSFLCRFTIRQGVAPTLQDAIRGSSLTVRFVANGLWIVDDRKVRFEIEPVTKTDLVRERAKQSAKVNGQGTVVVPMLAEKVIDNGLYQLRISPDTKLGNIFSPDFAGGGLELTPFDMGMMGRDEALSPSALIDSALRERGFILLEERRSGGADFVLRFGDAPQKVGIQYDLDADRGFLATECWSVQQDSGEVLAKLFVTDYLNTNGAWFPKRGVVVHNPETGPFHFREFVVTLLDTSRNLTDNDFVIEIPQGTTINDPTELGLQGVVTKPTKYSVTNLVALRERIAEAASEGRVEPRARWHTYLLGGIVVAVVVCGLILLWRQRLRTA
jgi:hypothetical protein